jgi:hypothetical protein
MKRLLDRQLHVSANFSVLALLRFALTLTGLFVWSPRAELQRMNASFATHFILQQRVNHPVPRWLWLGLKRRRRDRDTNSTAAVSS